MLVHNQKHFAESLQILSSHFEHRHDRKLNLLQIGLIYLNFDKRKIDQFQNAKIVGKIHSEVHAMNRAIHNAFD